MKLNSNSKKLRPINQSINQSIKTPLYIGLVQYVAGELRGAYTYITLIVTYCID